MAHRSDPQMGKESCETPPSERKELGVKCENNLKVEYKGLGYKVTKLPPNAPADLLVKKNGVQTFVEAKTGSSGLTTNEKNFQNQIERLGNNKIRHQIRHCSCDGTPLPDE
jgi:hypothetical protein